MILKNKIAFCAAVAAIFIGTSDIALSQEDLSYVDEFKGSSLSPAFQVINEDSARFHIGSDTLWIVTHERFKNVVTYADKIPENFDVTVRVEEPMLHANQIVLMRIGTPENNVRIGAYLGFQAPTQGVPMLTLGNSNRGRGATVTFYAKKTLQGEDSAQLDFDFEGLKGKPFYLRVSKNGVEFETLFSHNGTQWGSLGKQVMIDVPTEISFEAYNTDSAPETPVKFDYFSLKDLSVR